MNPRRKRYNTKQLNPRRKSYYRKEVSDKISVSEIIYYNDKLAKHPENTFHKMIVTRNK